MKSVLAAGALSLLACLGGVGCASPGADGSGADTASLRRAVSFHASFDGGMDADHARGDHKVYHAASMKRPRTGTPGLAPQVVHVKGEGRFGDAIRFTKKTSEVLFYNALGNLPYRAKDWSGTVSLWLRTDMANELAPGFADPIQITPREWNDAAFFVEFEKKPDITPFRLGAYADQGVWNPKNRKWDDIPFEERGLAPVINPPFSASRWTHVVFTFDRFNTGQKDGIARLYLDGESVAILSPRQQTFTWSDEPALIMLGLSYVGMMDEVSVFDRALGDEEVRQLHRLPRGVTGLLRR